MEPIEGSETSAIRTKTPENYPKENILHIENSESLNSRIYIYVCVCVCVCLCYVLCAFSMKKRDYLLTEWTGKLKKLSILCLPRTGD